MRKIIGSFFRQLLFWILFFNFSRVVFMIYHFRLIRVGQIAFSDLIGVFFYSFKLDLATACYFMAFPFLLLVIQSLSNWRWINTINKSYSGVLIFFYALSSVGEMGIYSEWKTKLNYKVIKYLNHPSEIYNSSDTLSFFLLLVILVAMVVVGITSYQRFFYQNVFLVRRNYWFTVIFFCITPCLLFLGMRGGVQPIPINQSESYYSKHNMLNLIAVNNVFNLYISVFENLGNFDRNPYVFMNGELADRIVKDIYFAEKDTTVQVITVSRPNIVLFIMESWSADLLESLGGKPGITPEVKKLEEEGVLFTRIYATGSRSEQGMASIFGGFPAHPVSSITVQPDKFVKLPSLVQVLRNEGYHTSFYFGGQLIYGNIKAYIHFNGFDQIMEVYDFPDSLPKGKLGIHDQYTMNYLIQDLNRMQQPFFASLFTLSTHSPWDQPFDKPLTWGENEREFINGAYYTDHCLGEFFRQAKNQSWYDNTLFIIVADHSHNSYYNWAPYSREYHKIPLLFLGNVIKPEKKGSTWDKIGNQQDLIATLLAQMGLPSDRFPWSKNLMNPYVGDFAYFSNENGAGWLRKKEYISFDLEVPYAYFFISSPEYQDSIRRESQAYLQNVFKEYLDN